VDASSGVLALIFSHLFPRESFLFERCDRKCLPGAPFEGCRFFRCEISRATDFGAGRRVSRLDIPAAGTPKPMGVVGHAVAVAFGVILYSDGTSSDSGV